MIAPSTGPRGPCTVWSTALTLHLLEDEAGRVLREVDVADLRVGGHDHRGGPVPAGEPGALAVRDDAVLVVEDVLAEVPDGSVVVLRVVIERDLLDAAVEIRDVLGDERLDGPALGPLDDPRPGQERGLGPEGLVVDGAVQDRRMEVADREERVRDLGGVGERRRDEVDPLALRRQRELVQPGGGQLLRRGLRNRRRARGVVVVEGDDCDGSHQADGEKRGGSEDPFALHGRNVGGPDESAMRSVSRGRGSES